MFWDVLSLSWDVLRCSELVLKYLEKKSEILYKIRNDQVPPLRYSRTTLPGSFFSFFCSVAIQFTSEFTACSHKLSIYQKYFRFYNWLCTSYIIILSFSELCYLFWAFLSLFVCFLSMIFFFGIWSALSLIR